MWVNFVIYFLLPFQVYFVNTLSYQNLTLKRQNCLILSTILHNGLVVDPVSCILQLLVARRECLCCFRLSTSGIGHLSALEQQQRTREAGDLPFMPIHLEKLLI